jgi:hypothetical protein
MGFPHGLADKSFPAAHIAADRRARVLRELSGSGGAASRRRENK